MGTNEDTLKEDRGYSKDDIGLIDRRNTTAQVGHNSFWISPEVVRLHRILRHSVY